MLDKRLFVNRLIRSEVRLGTVEKNKSVYPQAIEETNYGSPFHLQRHGLRAKGLLEKSKQTAS